MNILKFYITNIQHQQTKQKSTLIKHNPKHDPDFQFKMLNTLVIVFLGHRNSMQLIDPNYETYLYGNAHLECLVDKTIEFCKIISP